MCGIAGIFSLEKPLKVDLIKLMADTLRHRGPDDEGYLALTAAGNQLHHLIGPDSTVEGQHIDNFTSNCRLLLGHRRLSILDVSPAGHQPMSSADGAIWIIYNGELYNYIELREELKSLGYSFRSESDTEVLIAAYEEWGYECLGKFNGMWAFVIYDRRKNLLFGSRDRFGVKPFYYYCANSLLVFASEIKALTKLPFIEKRINPTGVFDYLVMGLEEYEEEGFFKGIFELLPSHALELNLGTGSWRKWKYYELECTDEWESFDENKSAKYIADTKSLLYNAVRLRLRSDVPVGSCLSGGVDSSAIVCIINEFLKNEEISQITERQKVFTASYPSENIDESRWAEYVVNATQTSWFQTFPTAQDLLSDLEDLVYSQDMPFLSTSIYSQYRVMKLAREKGIKVLLDGQGGDELFAGYVGLYLPFFLEIADARSMTTLFSEFRCLGNSPITKRFLISNVIKSLVKQILPQSMLEQYTVSRVACKYLSGDFLEAYRPRFRELAERTKPSLNKTLHGLMGKQNLKRLLRYEDRNSMRFSLESRTPFADDVNLIEFLFQVPSIYKIHEGWSKYLLRESANGILPEQIKQRVDKIGFATPQSSWLIRGKGYIGGLVDVADELLNTKLLARDFDTILCHESRLDTTSLWRFINYLLWKKEHISHTKD